MADNQADQHALSQGSTFVWHELYTSDLEGSKAFYTNVLGFGTQEMNMGDFTYNMLTKNGMPVAGVMDTATLEMPGVPPHWAVYIYVANVDETIAAAEGAGASVLVPAMDVPTVGRMALLKDPQGATVWIFTPDSNQG